MPLKVSLLITWADRSTNVEMFTVGPRERWERSLAQYRLMQGQNLNAVVEIEFDRQSAAFAAGWTAFPYSEGKTFSYPLVSQCR